MARMGVYDQIKKAFQDIVAPEIHELRGEFRRVDQKIDGVDARLNGRLDALDNKIDNVDQRLTAKLDALRTETVSMKGELIAEIRRLDTRMDGMDRELRTAIDIRERLAALEARRPA